MPASIAEYKRLCDKYSSNADRALAEEEFEKAGEFLWGCFATALKAHAARRGITLRTHRLIRRYAEQLSTETGDPTYRHAMVAAEGLHANYYEIELTAEDIVAGKETIQEALAKILPLLEYQDE